MSLYEAAKDALKLAQKADNAELVQKILDVQLQALDMQEKQFELVKRTSKLEEENKKLKELKKYIFADGKNYWIDPEAPERRLCPLCTKKNETPVPLDGYYCRQCKGDYSR